MQNPDNETRLLYAVVQHEPESRILDRARHTVRLFRQTVWAPAMIVYMDQLKRAQPENANGNVTIGGALVGAFLGGVVSATVRHAINQWGHRDDVLPHDDPMVMGSELNNVMVWAGGGAAVGGIVGATLGNAISNR